MVPSGKRTVYYWTCTLMVDLPTNNRKIMIHGFAWTISRLCSFIFLKVMLVYQKVYRYRSSSGWWFQSLWKILVNWDDYPQYIGKYKMFQTTNQSSCDYKSTCTSPFGHHRLHVFKITWPIHHDEADHFNLKEMWTKPDMPRQIYI